MSNKKLAFTLAEILITLGIIGVVAAMTIPNLISNTNGAKFRTQYKKTLTTLNEAGLLAQTQYNVNYGDMSQLCDDETPGSILDTDSLCAILNSTLTGTSYRKMYHMKMSNGQSYADLPFEEMPTIKNIQLRDWVFVLPDGAIVAIPDEAVNCSVPAGTSLTNAILTTSKSLGSTDERLMGLKQCIGYIDVNGIEPPNREVNCTEGETSATPEVPCRVENNRQNLTDIYPIVFHDAIVEPASNAAKFVLSSTK
ncbi:MAG: type II secretion system protein [Cyanobacteria bacterium SIG26]|nr:type II secretion system protein [Cyanobacteria bacterium SIG26]